MIVIKTPAEKMSEQLSKLLSRDKLLRLVSLQTRFSREFRNLIRQPITYVQTIMKIIFFTRLGGIKCYTYSYREAGVILSNTNLQTFRTQKTKWKNKTRRLEHGEDQGMSGLIRKDSTRKTVPLSSTICTAVALADCTIFSLGSVDIHSK